jgi:DNA-binding beta-propeller fold protein YncE
MTRGTLVQLPGTRGCLAAPSKAHSRCKPARALGGPGPFLGSRAIALSPDGKNVYVASSGSDAIAIFARNTRKGGLAQGKGTAGCIAVSGAGGCEAAIGLDGPNVVTVSPDGKNVYIGSFFGNAIAVFNRDPATGALTQPTSTTGCITQAPTSGCATGLALGAPEGMAISGDGSSVYAATAVSNALAIFTRDPTTGALTQATDGSGCIVAAPLAGCTTGAELSGANAVAVGPGDKDVYVTSLLSNSVTSFTRSSTGAITQKPGTAGCLVFLRAVGCSLGHALAAPEGLAVSPEGAGVYAAAFVSGAIGVLNRNPKSGGLIQKPLGPGCVGKPALPDCLSGRGLNGVSSIALSPDGRFAYAAAFRSNAVAVFRRVTSPKAHSTSSNAQHVTK